MRVGGKGESGFVKDDMPRDNNTTRGKTYAPVSLVIGGVSKENTGGGSGGEFVWHGGGCAGVTQAPENSQMIVRWWFLIEAKVWGRKV